MIDHRKQKKFEKKFNLIFSLNFFYFFLTVHITNMPCCYFLDFCIAGKENTFWKCKSLTQWIWNSVPLHHVCRTTPCPGAWQNERTVCECVQVDVRPPRSRETRQNSHMPEWRMPKSRCNWSWQPCFRLSNGSHFRFPE